MWKRTSVALLALLLPQLLLPGPAAATPGVRLYSVAYEYGYSYRQTGVLSVHAYAGVMIQPGASCTAFYNDDANTVYLTQWVTFTDDAREHVEVGVGIQCQNFVYRFWGYRTSGIWIPIGEEVVAADANGHYFETYRLTTGSTAWWYFKIDGVQKGRIDLPFAGRFVDVGVESTNYANVVPNHWFSQLQLTFDEGPWYFWGYEQYARVDATTCGLFRSPIQWSAAQNSGCS